MRRSLAILCLSLILTALAYSQEMNRSAAVLEQLCANLQKSPSQANQKRLLAYCERNKASQGAGLGYFRLGYQAFQEEKYPSASLFLEKAAKLTLPIDDFVQFYLGESLFRSKWIEQALERFDTFLSGFPDSPLRERALSSYREAALAAGKPQAVLDSMKFTPNVTSDADALFFAASAQEALGQLKDALEKYQRIHYLFPLSRRGSTVSQRITEISAGDTALNGPIPEEWKISRIEKLYSSKRYAECLKDLQPLLNSDPGYAVNSRYQLWLGISQFGVGRYLDAVETFKRINSADKDLKAQAGYMTAESFRKLNDYDYFKAAVEVMETEFPSSKWFEEALFGLGNYHLVRRDLDNSSAYYEKLLSFFPQGAHAEDAHWRVSWQRYRQKDYSGSLGKFLEHLGRYKSSPHASAAIYWAARAKEHLGEEDQALKIYQVLAEKTPNSYYGQLAGKRLNNDKRSQLQSLPPDLQQAISVLDLRSKEAAKVNWQQMDTDAGDSRPRVKALATIQLFDLAAIELMRREVYGDSPLLTVQAARLYFRGKKFSASLVLLRKIVPGYVDLPFEALPRPVWEMLYPAEYFSLIERESRRYRIDPYWVMSLIRQESLFNPRALSSANAHGLMQLLPSTARLVGRQMKLRRTGPARLFEPELNIRLGMRHFSDLLKVFDGQMEMALASYNAGVDRVTAWMSEGGYSDNTEFVETIPFSETRDYVKIISRGYWFYRILYGRS